MNVTKEKVIEVFKTLNTAVLDTIREAPNGAPEGPMYAAFVAHGLSLETFQTIINGMIDLGVIRREGHLLFLAKKQ